MRRSNTGARVRIGRLTASLPNESSASDPSEKSNKADGADRKIPSSLTRRFLSKRTVQVGFVFATVLAALQSLRIASTTDGSIATGRSHDDSDRNTILRLLSSSRSNGYTLRRDNTNVTHDHPRQIAGPYLDYRAAAGLGHRLTRAAAAYHLARRLGVGLRQNWGTCPAPSPSSDGHAVGIPEKIDIWEHLFGEGEVEVVEGSKATVPHAHGSRRANRTDSNSKKLTISNEVPGYRPYAIKKLRESPLSEELYTAGVEFYQQLRYRFTNLHMARMKDFVTDTKFTNRSTIIGIHVRAGNGEGGEFTLKQRGLGELSSWAREVARVVASYIATEKTVRDGPPLVFVASDTASVVGLLVDAFREVEHVTGHIDVMSLPQHRSDGTGPSYKLKNERCLSAWTDQMMDMVFLSLSHVIISARYSSFTQSMPMSLLFGKVKRHQVRREPGIQHPTYCELGPDGSVMVCFSSLDGWKARSRRENPNRMSYTVSGTSRKLYIPQKDPHEDSLAYPLATNDCLDKKRSAEDYFSDADCFKADLLCQTWL